METTQQVIAGIYSRLHRPSQQKLHYEDVREIVYDLLRGYFQDRVLGEKDQVTQVANCTLTQDDIDYILQVENAEDFEAVALEYSYNGAQTGSQRGWLEADLLPLDSFSRSFMSDKLVASIYGSLDTGKGYKIRFNQSDDYIANTLLRIRYRPSIVAIVQMGERPLLPSNFIPMLKCEGAMLALARVRDNSNEWLNRATMLASAFQYELEGGNNPNNWRRRWQKYLDTSVEPTVQPIPRFDSFRVQGRRMNQRGHRIIE